MLTVNKLISKARGLAAVLVKRAASVELDWDVRQKSRFDAIDSSGRTLGVFLPRGTVVRGGDMLVAEDGTMIVVKAASQPVMVVSACAEHSNPFDLLRAAYHLGNRHVQLELQPEHLKLEPDHVLAGMLRQMHLVVTETTSAFEPESGAYAAGAHARDAHKVHDLREVHDVPLHAHAHSPAPSSFAAPHVHGAGCDHGHDHDH